LKDEEKMVSESDPTTTALSSVEARQRWRERGARLDAKLQRNMRVTVMVVALALTLIVVWMMALR
jgi:type IV secretory pathway TrbF-like protein